MTDDNPIPRYLRQLADLIDEGRATDTEFNMWSSTAPVRRDGQVSGPYIAGKPTGKNYIMLHWTDLNTQEKFLAEVREAPCA